MKKVLSLLLIGSLILSMLLFGSGWTSVQKPASTALKGGTVRYAVWSSPKGVFLPALSNDSYNYDTISLVFEPLLRLNPKLQLEKCLATSYTISKDKKTVTFKLRNNVKWHDGQPFTAEDVQYTFEFMGNADYSGPYGSFIKPIVGADKFKNKQSQHIEGIKVIDAYTISFTTSNVYANALLNFGNSIRIMPKHIWEKVAVKDAAKAAELLKNPVGTGPFKMSKFVPDQYVELVANDKYWGGSPIINKIIIQVANQDTAQAQMLNGEIDFMTISQMNKDDLKLYKDNKIQVQTVHSNSYQFMGMNNELEIFKDVKVRRALNYAVNRASMVKDILNGYGVIATNPYRPDFWASANGLNQFKYNPNTAIGLLKQAGWEYRTKEKLMYRNGKPVEFSLVYPSGDKPREAAAAVIQQNLKAIGIQVDLQIMEFNTALSKIQKGTYELCLMGMGGSPGDPDITRFFGSSAIPPNGLNLCRIKNKTLDQLLKTGQNFVAVKDQKTIYNEVSKLINQEVPAVFLYFQDAGKAINGKLNGVQCFGGGNNFYNVEKWYFTK
jgi:peptide/nickel transport system substrate-binding protein